MQEKTLKAKPGMPMLILFIVLYLAAIGLIIVGGVLLERGISAAGGTLLAVGIVWVLSGLHPVLGAKGD